MSTAPSPAASSASSSSASAKAGANSTAGVPPSSTALFSPSVAQILASFEKDGNGDTELLKVLLAAKKAEDDRLTALDTLRAEQLRTANTLAMSQLYYASFAAPSYPPYSPTSPPAELTPWSRRGSVDHKSISPLPPYSQLPQMPFHHRSSLSSASNRSLSNSPPPPSASTYAESRKRATSSASTSSSRSIQSSHLDEPANKKTKRAPSSTSSSSSSRGGPTGKPSHEDVMAALRNKCQQNQSRNSSTAVPGWTSMMPPQPIKPASTAATKAAATSTPSTKSRALAPRPSSPPARSAGSPPLRHSAFFAPRGSPEASTPVSSSTDTPATTNEVDRAAGSLRMLLNSGNGGPQNLVAAVNVHHRALTSDLRSEAPPSAATSA